MADIIKTATRDAYGKALVELGGINDKIVVLDADLAAATKTGMFKKAYPDRFFDSGIAESNMMGVAAGLATTGYTVFASTFAMFAAGRAYEQVRNSIAYPHLSADALVGKRFSSFDRFIDHKARCDYRHVAALTQGGGLAELEFIALVKNSGHCKPAESHINGAFVFGGGENCRSGLDIVSGVDYDHTGDNTHERDILAALVARAVLTDGDARKFKSFGWNVLEISAHSFDEIDAAFNAAAEFKGKPSVIVASSVKGKGVSFMEGEDSEVLACELCAESHAASGGDALTEGAGAHIYARGILNARVTLKHGIALSESFKLLNGEEAPESED